METIEDEPATEHDIVGWANHSAAQRWWRTLPDELTVAQAQASLDAFCARTGDTRSRKQSGEATTVAALAQLEPLAPLPPAFPAVLREQRIVTAQALVAWRGNFYSVPPGLAGATMTISHRLGSTSVEVATATGTVLARHHREADGAGVLVRDAGHVRALERAVLAEFDTSKPCARKVRRPPSPAALAHADHLTRAARPGLPAEREVVVDLARYARAALDRQVAR